MAAIVFNSSGTVSFKGDQTLAVIEFDVVTEEVHTLAAKVTEHPVEKSQAVSDHVRAEPTKVSIKGIVTNTPINDMSVPSDELLARAKRADARMSSIAPLAMTQQDLQLEYFTSRQTRTAQVDGPSLIPIKIPGVPADAFGGQAKLSSPSEFESVRNTVGGKSLQAVTPVDRVRAVFEVLRNILKTGTQVVLVTDLQDYAPMVITNLSAPRTGMDAIEFSMELSEIKLASTKIVEVSDVYNPKEKRAEKFEAAGLAAGYRPSAAEEAHKTSFWASGSDTAAAGLRSLFQ